MSDKVSKFASLLHSPSGNTEVKQDIISSATSSSASEVVKMVGKKRTSFDIDAELHQWLKMYSVRNNRKMAEVLEDILIKFKEEQE